VTAGRADQARALAAGWRPAEAELCRNPWFGDATRLAEDARSAFAASVAERLEAPSGPGPMTAWDDPLRRCLLLRDEDLGPAAATLLVQEHVPAGDGGGFARALVDGDHATAAAALTELLAAGGGAGPRAARFDDVFDRFVLPQLTDGPVGHQAATPEVADRLLAVCSRTARATPQLFESAWSFVGDVAVIAEPDAGAMAARQAPLPDSFSQPGLSGIVFFSPWVLDLPWHAEVTVLHEAVHQKLYTLLLTRPLFDEVVDEDATSVYVPWRDTTWPVRRAVSACHAYVHMAVAFGALVDWAVEHDEPLTPDDGGGDDPLVLLQVHVERMLYLSEQVSRFDRATLAEAGVDLVRWLRSVALDLADAGPRPNPGLGVHP